MNMIVELWNILDKSQRRQVYYLTLLCIINAIFEFFSLGLVFALSISVLSPHGSLGPQKWIANVLGPDILASKGAAPFLAIAVITIFFTKSCFGIFTNWVRAKIVYHQNVIFSERLLQNYLSRGWSFILENDLVKLKGYIVDDCEDFVFSCFNNGAILLTELCVCFALFVGLLMVNPGAMVSLVIFMVLILAMLHKMLKSTMRIFWTRAWNAKMEARQTVEVALSGAKEVMLYHREGHFGARLRANLNEESRAASMALTLQDSPRQVIDFLAVGTFMIFLIVEYSMGVSVGGIGVVASVFGTAAYRLLPSVSRISSSFGALTRMKDLFERLRPDFTANRGAAQSLNSKVALTFKDSIELKNLGFCYGQASVRALDGISVRICRGQRVGLVGPSGAGKSTLVGILLGLLFPTVGELLIDGIPLDSESRRAWQDKLAYVPQDVFLDNDNFINNIAFGVPRAEIDQLLVKQAAKAAGIADFIETETSNGYETILGDRGVRLSGGQRQRIAIARALYRKAEVLVFDEATSALDNISEKIVSESIALLNRELTIVIVAHRLSSVRYCDEILVLDKGVLVQRGGFEELSTETGVFGELLHAKERIPAA